MSLITPLYAANGTGGAFDFLQFVPFVLVFVVMYVFLIRPQQKKQAQHKTLIEALKVGDTVVTQSGLIGKISALVDAEEVLLSVAPGCDVRFVKTMIVRTVDKKEPKKVRTLDKERKKGGAKNPLPRKTKKVHNA